MDETLIRTGSAGEGRRRFLAAGAAGLAVATLHAEPTIAQTAKAPAGAPPEVVGTEHWAIKRVGGDSVRLFLLRKKLRDAAAGGPRRGTILFVHGSSMAGTPVFDLQVPGKPEYSVMNWFARLGYDTWCIDCEGYGRSDKSRPINADVSTGADDVAAATEYMSRVADDPRPMLYGASSGALRVALFAQRHPGRAKRVALDAFVWTGEGSPTLADRKQRSSSIVPRTGARSTAVRAQHIHPRPSGYCRSRRSSTRSPMPCSRSTLRFRPEPTSTCRPTCRSSIPRRSTCRR